MGYREEKCHDCMIVEREGGRNKGREGGREREGRREGGREGGRKHREPPTSEKRLMMRSAFLLRVRKARQQRFL